MSCHLCSDMLERMMAEHGEQEDAQLAAHNAAVSAVHERYNPGLPAGGLQVTHVAQYSPFLIMACPGGRSAGLVPTVVFAFEPFGDDGAWLFFEPELPSHGFPAVHVRSAADVREYSSADVVPAHAKAYGGMLFGETTGGVLKFGRVLSTMDAMRDVAW